MSRQYKSTCVKVEHNINDVQLHSCLALTAYLLFAGDASNLFSDVDQEIETSSGKNSNACL